MISGWNLDDKYNCKSCGYRIPITGERAKEFRYRDIESVYIPVIKSSNWLSELLRGNTFRELHSNLVR